MVATGVHILIGLALVLLVSRSGRAEPYLVVALAAMAPDIDTFVFRPLVEFGYVSGPLWSHRGLTHSLLGGVVVVALLAYFGPWRAAAIGFGSHVGFDMLTGGVRLFAPVDPTLYGTSVDWLLLNMLASVVAVIIILGGLLGMKYDFERPIDAHAPKTTLEWFR
ncbi:metal-dependent hydrolase [Natrinema versiforme]|uniref:Metal-dependent hydrolase n=1 Tax=Natrinema versiforme TaxID=88724 RepID=A0A4P8WIR9_9EURY|nr:metal-dependent hydrolase [Natrinema versiforme]QCS41913.1 metal-dependent hydrolase [Natrinema versiforme]